MQRMAQRAPALSLLQVQESDMHRVAMATGAQTQTTVNNLNPKVLGSVESFEEKQVCFTCQVALSCCISRALCTVGWTTCGLHGEFVLTQALHKCRDAFIHNNMHEQMNDCSNN